MRLASIIHYSQFETHSDLETFSFKLIKMGSSFIQIFLGYVNLMSLTSNFTLQFTFRKM